jgi:hypothetical protein
VTIKSPSYGHVPSDSEDDRRAELVLMKFLTHEPKRTSQLAIATGMAVALELVERGQLAALHTLSVNERLCFQSCARVLHYWGRADRVGAVSECDFARLVDEILAIALSH